MVILDAKTKDLCEYILADCEKGKLEQGLRMKKSHHLHKDCLDQQYITKDLTVHLSVLYHQRRHHAVVIAIRNPHLL